MTVYTRHQTPPTPADPPGPAGLWMPWYTGLGEVCIPCPQPILCTLTDACSGSPPAQLKFILSEITNDSCSSCENLNGEYTLALKRNFGYYDHGMSYFGCWYELVLDESTPCGWERLVALIATYQYGGYPDKYTVNLYLPLNDNPPDNLSFVFQIGFSLNRLVSDGPFDCGAWNNTSMNRGYTQPSAVCTYTSAAATITSL